MSPDPLACFVAFGPVEHASARYRVYGPVEYAPWAMMLPWADVQAEYDALLEGEPPASVLVWPKWHDEHAARLAGAWKAKGAKLVWDLCDPVWLLSGKAEAFLPLADELVASATALADAASAWSGRACVWTIPDRMDPAFHPTVRRHRETTEPVLLWFGQRWNRLPGLASALLGLQFLAARGARFRLRILDDGEPGGVSIDGVTTEYHRWKLDTFHEELLAADVALCPLYAGPWGRLKSDNKRASAYWAGLPVVDLDDEADMHYALALLESASLRASEGAANRACAEQHYDVRQSVEEWEDVLRALV